MAESKQSADVLTTFRFVVEFDGPAEGGDALSPKPSGAFSEVSGLEFSIETVDVREGGYNFGVRRLIGRGSCPPILLKRGLSSNGAFWKRLQNCVSSPGGGGTPYVSGRIKMLAADTPPGSGSAGIATFRFHNALVARVKTSDLRALGGTEVAIEEVELRHEGLVREGMVNE